MFGAFLTIERPSGSGSKHRRQRRHLPHGGDEASLDGVARASHVIFVPDWPFSLRVTLLYHKRTYSQEGNEACHHPCFLTGSSSVFHLHGLTPVGYRPQGVPPPEGYGPQGGREYELHEQAHGVERGGGQERERVSETAPASLPEGAGESPHAMVTSNTNRESVLIFGSYWFFSTSWLRLHSPYGLPAVARDLPAQGYGRQASRARDSVLRCSRMRAGPALRDSASGMDGGAVAESVREFP
jgi:hypothetical protein